MKIIPIAELKKRHRGRWFEDLPFTVRVLYPHAYVGVGGTFFVSGELAGDMRYTVRCQRHGGDIMTISGYREYSTERAATMAAMRLADEV